MKEFYIALADTQDTKNLSALCHHALDTLKNETQGKPFELDSFSLINPFTDDDKPSVHVRYSLLPNTEKRRRKNARVLASAWTISNAEKEKRTLHGSKDKVCAVEIRQPIGEGQDDAIQLIPHLIEELKLVNDRRVTDIVYHDYCDDTGVRRPYFRFYYIN